MVIENIARHWGMKREGQSRMQAAIEAVAEVGNPTIVATLTVVVALLPMLFVSGLMGPYMSPIPANASAAMIFSFFVAVIITPWLMVKIAGRATCCHATTTAMAAITAAGWGALYAARRPAAAADQGAEPGVPAGRRPRCPSGRWRALYTRDVTVKLLPFDNKSELSVSIDLPEGSASRRRTAWRRTWRAW